MPGVIVNQPTANNIAPQMPTTPPPEVLKQSFSLGDFDPSAGGEAQVTVDHKPVIEDKGAKEVVQVKDEDTKPKVEEAKKPEEQASDKKEETASSVLKAPKEEGKATGPRVEDKKEVVKPITPVTAKKEDTFDYSKYTTEQQGILKQMSNTAKSEYAKVLDENKSLSSLRDSNYLQDPNAYTLSPDYQKLQVDLYRAQIEGQCWEQMILDIRAGKEYKEITGFDKNNNPIFAQPKKANDRDELRANSAYTACVGAASTMTSKLQEFPNSFKSRITQDLISIQQEQKNRFAWHQDPKLLDYTVDVEGRGETKLATIKSDFKSIWPAYLQNSPAVDVCADMFVAMQIQSAELRQAKNSQQVAQIQKEEIARGEPSSDAREVNEQKAVGGVKEFSLGNMGETLGLR